MGRQLFLEHAAKWDGTKEAGKAEKVYDEIAGREHEIGADQIIAWARCLGVDPVLIAAYVFDFEPSPEGSGGSGGRYRRHDGWEGMLQGNKSGPLGNLHNALMAFRHASELAEVFRYDQFSNVIEVSKCPPWLAPWEVSKFEPHPMEDVEHVRARKWLQDHDIQTSASDAYNAVLAAAHDEPFHPVRDYLDGLQWDGTARIDTWLVEHVGAVDTPLNRANGSRFLIGLVARVKRPGCKLDTMLIFEGRQGLKKSGALRCLTSPWFVDQIPDIGSKDAMLQLQGSWLIEFAEMHTATRAEIGRMKNFMTVQTDKFRMPYGHVTKTYGRQCAFAGTINPADEYLEDETGARRYPSVVCGMNWQKGRTIDLEKLAAVRDQLWAEARVRFERGDVWWLDTLELVDAAAAAADERYAADVWTDPVLEWVASKSAVTTGEVLVGALDVQKRDWTKPHQRRVGGILRTAGWIKKQDPTESTDEDGKKHRPRRYHNPNPPTVAPADMSNVSVLPPASERVKPQKLADLFGV
jgi:predicted P-loop ATPase